MAKIIQISKVITLKDYEPLMSTGLKEKIWQGIEDGLSGKDKQKTTDINLTMNHQNTNITYQVFCTRMRQFSLEHKWQITSNTDNKSLNHKRNE